MGILYFSAEGYIMEITNDKFKNALQLAFNFWLQDYKSDVWTDLTSEERLILSEYHFEKFMKEIKNI